MGLGKGSEVTDRSIFNVYSQYIPDAEKALADHLSLKTIHPQHEQQVTTAISINGQDIQEDMHRSFCEPNQPSAPAIVLLNADK